jgi:predicted ABC-type ATPase
LSALETLDRRPLLVVLAGPNGAGKSTFYKTYLKPAGMRFVNADEIARDLGVDAYRAAKIAEGLRRSLIAERASFIFETVFSDPVGDKLQFMKDAELAGYTVVLFFIGIKAPEVSEERVAIRVLKGGQDVPPDKIVERYPRVMQNLRRALVLLSNLRVYDNSDLLDPYRVDATREEAGNVVLDGATPEWLVGLLA